MGLIFRISFKFRWSYILIPLLFTTHLQAESIFSSDYRLVGFGGIYVNSDLMPISYKLDFKYKQSNLWALGVNRELDWKYSIFKFELEGLVGIHSGAMSHSEVVGVAIARVPDIFGLPVSIALGEGQSIASKTPRLEELRYGIDKGKFNLDDLETKPWLNYLMFEVDYRLPKYFDNSKLFVRIHHRSGIYGVYCPPTPPCGSNFLVYGLKIPL
ncbi:hypothetical protein [Leptospira sp. GIMC2001]|uniref:hypothetical protein n=1 Tax=Leptospira sp. GIMC2001 TaxID=1513297 RepID=UPI00234B8760|nr:hypothetical protein [Leptospira sp. GIMC2001]WCL50243.1 hypothetical protein O4O04_05325 [Leptospira sp. GIMC2001]